MTPSGSSTLLITGITSCGSYSAFRLFSSSKAHFIACQLAPTFAVIGHNWQIKLQAKELANHSGLA